MNEKEILIELLKFNELQLKFLAEQINDKGVVISENTVDFVNRISLLASNISEELMEVHKVSNDELIEILEKLWKK
jgi:hypothetical protein